MAYTPLSERVAKRLAEIQGLKPEVKPKPFFRMTPDQIMKAVRNLGKKPGK